MTEGSLTKPVIPGTGPEVTDPKGVEVYFVSTQPTGTSFAVQGWRWFNLLKKKKQVTRHRARSAVNQSEAEIKKKN